VAQRAARDRSTAEIVMAMNPKDRSPGRQRNRAAAVAHDDEVSRLFRSRGLPAPGPVELDKTGAGPASVIKGSYEDRTPEKRESAPVAPTPFANLTDSKK
jgi:hypothetical protein